MLEIPAFWYFLRYIKVQFSAICGITQNSVTMISFICQACVAGPWILERCEICIIPGKSLGSSGLLDEQFFCWRISWLSTMDDHY